ncbi:synaptobrevin [Bisporella sp. PMI_857]|nr:synaptobrevin [Bisporella sp. PMI_857]
MNTLFNTALKQSTSLKRDLSSPPALLTPSLLGQISASLTSFSRTLDSYASLIKTELNAAKKAKAEERLQNFRQELQEFREGYLELKRQGEEAEAVGQKNELFGRRPHHTGTPDNPYANSTASPTNVGGGVNGWQGGQMSAHAPDVTREQHALREQTFFQNTHSALDEYLARGQAVLGDLSQQREVMKGTQKRLRSVANTLGVSGETIRMVERRAKQDKWIFGIGVVVFFGFCWGVLKIFR